MENHNALNADFKSVFLKMNNVKYWSAFQIRLHFWICTHHDINFLLYLKNAFFQVIKRHVSYVDILINSFVRKWQILQNSVTYILFE